MYLPWMSFPLGTERKSGFLFPSFGHTTRSGLQIAVPYYWNIAPHDGPHVRAGLLRRARPRCRRRVPLPHRDTRKARFRSTTCRDDQRNRRLAPSLQARPRGRAAARHPLHRGCAERERHQLFRGFRAGPGRHERRLPRALRAAAAIATSTGCSQPKRRTSRRSTASSRLERRIEPYSRLPRLLASSDFGWGPAQQLRYGFDSELVNFHRSIGVTGWRLDAMPQRAARLRRRPDTSCARALRGATLSTSSTITQAGSGRLALAHPADREPRYRA